MSAAKILLVEDEAIVALDLRMQLEDLGYEVTGVADHSAKALALAEQHRPDLVLMDVRLKGPVDGIQTAAALSQSCPTPVVYLTSHSDDETVRRAADTAPYGYLTKPFQIRELRAAIEVALTKSHMERQLRDNERWFASTLRCVHDGVILTGTDARVRFMNPAAEALCAWQAEEAVGLPIGQVVRFESAGPDAEPQPTAAVARALAQDRVVGTDHGLPLLRRDGNRLPVDQSAGPIDNELGERLGAVLVLRDARPRLQQEARLRASEERFRRSFDHAPLGMALVALDGQFLQVNAALCRLFATDPVALCRRRHDDITWPADRANEQRHLRALLDGESIVVQFEKRYLKAAGAEPLWTLVSVSLLREDGEAACWLYQVHDLTEHKRAAEQMAELAAERMKREASEVAARVKSDFLSRASHEMRTPLNAVIGFAHLLQQHETPRDPEQVRRFAGHIHQAGEHLLAMVNDVLDLQQVSQGGLRMQLTAVDLSDAVESACQMLLGQAQEMGLEVRCMVPPALQVRADATRLRQVLLNVGSNAVKYNRRGGEIALRAEPLPGGRVRLVVSDTGIGMSAEQMGRLFQPFERLGRERGNIPGTGLGLLIARNLVAQMGGSLEVDSRPDSGTQVAIELAQA